jgi:hypothetical protein
VNCCELPEATEGFGGATAIDTSAGAVTVRLVEPVTPFSVAIMLELPVVALVAKPVAAIVATLGADELHADAFVRFAVVPLL